METRVRSGIDIARDDELTRRIIGAAIEVHKALGPGLLESVYEECLRIELSHQGISFQSQVSLPILYRGQAIQRAFRLDLIVEDVVIVELKAVDTLHPVHEAQLLTHLRLTNKRVGLLFNFNTPLLRDGLKRLVL